jgi:hypothetical protein
VRNSRDPTVLHLPLSLRHSFQKKSKRGKPKTKSYIESEGINLLSHLALKITPVPITESEMERRGENNLCVWKIYVKLCQEGVIKIDTSVSRIDTYFFAFRNCDF